MQLAKPLNGLTYIKGSPIDIQSLKGKKVVVVEFWATWCPPCRTTIPHLSKLASEFSQVEFIGITNETDEKTVRSFVDNMGATMNYTVALDTKSQTHKSYMTAHHIRSIPYAFVVDLHGQISWKGHPMDDKMVKAIQSALREVIRPDPKLLSPAELQALSVTTLRGILQSHGIDYSDCLEKCELLERINQKVLEQ